MDNFTPPLYFEYFALLLWAVSGAIVGWRKGYDVVGVFVIAFVSSFGGGLLRDGLFLQDVYKRQAIQRWLERHCDVQKR